MQRRTEYSRCSHTVAGADSAPDRDGYSPGTINFPLQKKQRTVTAQGDNYIRDAALIKIQSCSEHISVRGEIASAEVFQFFPVRLNKIRMRENSPRESFPVRIEKNLRAGIMKLQNHASVGVLGNSRRNASRDDCRIARPYPVRKLLHQLPDLVFGDSASRFIDVCVCILLRVTDFEIGPGFEIPEDKLAVKTHVFQECLKRSSGTAAEQCKGRALHTEALQYPRHIDAFSAGICAQIPDPVYPVRGKMRYDCCFIQCRIQGNCINHV